MYYYLKGKVVKKDKQQNICILDVNNIGYEIFMSPSTLEEVEINQEVLVYIVEVSSGLYSSNLPILYGFLSLEEKEIFLSFKENLANVGPKKALEYLDKAKRNIKEFKIAIKNKNYKSLVSLFGFKHSSAEKIINALSNLEIFKEIPEETEITNVDIYLDLVSALVNLGYKENLAKSISQKILAKHSIDKSKDTQQIISELLPLALNEISQIHSNI